jgi:hypothetical protein
MVLRSLNDCLHKFLLLAVVLCWTSIVQAQTIVSESETDSLIHYEKRFSKNYSTPAPKDKNWFEYHKGRGKILIVAGHATAQTREGNIKVADAGTGSLAVALHKILDIPVLYTTYLSPSDPNFYDDNAFKDSLLVIIEKIQPILILDLHASRASRDYEVDIGTMHGVSYLTREDLLESLQSSLKKGGFSHLSQDFFSAEKNLTITKFVSKRGVPCMQLELNHNLISPSIDDNHREKSKKLLQSLVVFIESIK